MNILDKIKLLIQFARYGCLDSRVQILFYGLIYLRDCLAYLCLLENDNICFWKLANYWSEFDIRIPDEYEYLFGCGDEYEQDYMIIKEYMNLIYRAYNTEDEESEQDLSEMMLESFGYYDNLM